MTITGESDTRRIPDDGVNAPSKRRGPVKRLLALAAVVIGFFLAGPGISHAAGLGASLPIMNRMEPGDSLDNSGPNGTYRLVMETDGNLVHYHSTDVYGIDINQPCWASDTSGPNHVNWILDIGAGPVLQIADSSNNIIRTWEGYSTGGEYYLEVTPTGDVFISGRLLSAGLLLTPC